MKKPCSVPRFSSFCGLKHTQDTKFSSLPFEGVQYCSPHSAEFRVLPFYSPGSPPRCAPFSLVSGICRLTFASPYGESAIFSCLWQAYFLQLRKSSGFMYVAAYMFLSFFPKARNNHYIKSLHLPYPHIH